MGFKRHYTSICLFLHLVSWIIKCYIKQHNIDTFPCACDKLQWGQLGTQYLTTLYHNIHLLLFDQHRQKCADIYCRQKYADISFTYEPQQWTLHMLIWITKLENSKHMFHPSFRRITVILIYIKTIGLRAGDMSFSDLKPTIWNITEM